MTSIMSDYRNEFKHACSFQESMDVLAEVTSTFGFTQVLYAYLPVPPRLPDGEWMPLKLNVRNFPTGWYNGWKDFEKDDPYYHFCFRGTLPFEWGDVQNCENLNAREKDAWKYLADFGLHRGITTPIHLPGGRFAAISAIVDRPRANWSNIKSNAKSKLLCLTHVFHDVIHERGFEKEIKYSLPVSLSPREKECLGWAAAGKTSVETAIIIDRSMETVRLHIKNAMLKLGVHNRVHAVAKAVQMGLIEPCDTHTNSYVNH
jgi:LuxR family transcriptional regulator